MKKNEYLDYLQDILDEISNIEEFVRGMSYKDFSSDKKTVNAVIRSLEVIGEASRKVPRAIKAKYKELPWKEMAGMRDKLIHEYFGVDLEIVWVVATEEAPPLKDSIKKIIKETE